MDLKTLLGWADAAEILRCDLDWSDRPCSLDQLWQLTRMALETRWPDAPKEPLHQASQVILELSLDDGRVSQRQLKQVCDLLAGCTDDFSEIACELAGNIDLSVEDKIRISESVTVIHHARDPH